MERAGLPRRQDEVKVTLGQASRALFRFEVFHVVGEPIVAVGHFHQQVRATSFANVSAVARSSSALERQR